MIAACAMAAGFAGAAIAGTRILSEITSSAQAPLKKCGIRRRSLKNDAGRMPADRQLSGITMYFNRSAGRSKPILMH